jgi:hypothetical protein
MTNSLKLAHFKNSLKWLSNGPDAERIQREVKESEQKEIFALIGGGYQVTITRAALLRRSCSTITAARWYGSIRSGP